MTAWPNLPVMKESPLLFPGIYSYPNPFHNPVINNNSNNNNNNSNNNNNDNNPQPLLWGGEAHNEAPQVTSTSSNSGATPSSSSMDSPGNNNGQDGGKRSKSLSQRSSIQIPDFISVDEGEDGAPTMYKCRRCTKKFKTKAHIRYHEYCQGDLDKPFKCTACDQGFIVKSHYEYHLRNHKGHLGKLPFICPKCGKGFNEREKMTQHMRVHSEQRPFLCPKCGRGFVTTHALKAHSVVHSEERPFSCKYCDKRFKTNANLKIHESKHSGPSMMMRGNDFPALTHNQSGMNSGKNGWTPNTNSSSNSKTDKPFKCTVCSSTFKHENNMQRHMKRVHQSFILQNNM